MIALFVLLLASPVRAAVAPESEIRLAWTYENLPPEMRVFEASATAPGVWTTKVSDDPKEIPAGRALPDGCLTMKAGEERTLVLVYRNTGKVPLRFFAAPHAVKPAVVALGFDFECLCLNHVYSVAPGRWWWRVVRLSLSREFAAKRLTVTHAVVRVTRPDVRGVPLPPNR